MAGGACAKGERGRFWAGFLPVRYFCHVPERATNKELQPAPTQACHCTTAWYCRAMKLAIIVPVLNEGAALAVRLQALQTLRARGAQVVVVDGGDGSNGSNPEQIGPLADLVLQAPRGRAAQMNAGAWALCQIAPQITPQPDALLFLHADTQLPPDADGLIAAALQHHAWGRFDVHIEGQSPWLPLVAALMNLRSRLSGMATGDQALFVRRRVFEKLGGFAPLPLMEDLEICQRLKTVSAPACLKARVTTSGRRWDQHGAWRVITLMWRLRAAWYAAGRQDAVRNAGQGSGLRAALAHALALRYGYQPRAGAAVAVLAKAPVPGLAKTRLIPALRPDGTALGPQGAARAQRGFTLRTLRTAAQASTGAVTLWCTPTLQHRFFRALQRRWGVVCAVQPEGDIGVRMGAAMAAHFGPSGAELPAESSAKSGVLPLLIVGTDCPAFAPAHLQQAADALQNYDAVLVPAEDGGYVLLGVRKALPGVFEGVEWSTSQVMAQTRLRLQALGASWVELPTLWDVDTPEDWQRFQPAIQALRISRPHTIDR